MNAWGHTEVWTSPESREIWLSPVISIRRARKIVKVRPIYKTKAMKGELGWENVKLGIVENEPVSETFRKRTNARKCWLNSDKELNHLSTVSWWFSGAHETPVWFLTGIRRKFFLVNRAILEDSIMKALLSCEFNMDTDCIELKYSGGSIISINCSAVEEEVANSRFQRVWTGLTHLQWSAVLCGIDFEWWSRKILANRNGDPSVRFWLITL